MARWIARSTLLGWIAMTLAGSAQPGSRAWWAPGQVTPLADFATYEDDCGLTLMWT